jgi:hypothetical protein
LRLAIIIIVIIAAATSAVLLSLPHRLPFTLSDLGINISANRGRARFGFHRIQNPQNADLTLSLASDIDRGADPHRYLPPQQRSLP